jgi:hypothetical protein
MSDSKLIRKISGERKEFFLQKVARSIMEVQPNVNSIGDVLVFLEVLGYTNKAVRENGYENLYDLSKQAYDFIGYFTEPVSIDSSLNIPRKGRRIVEAVALTFPFVGSWSLLILFGVSLWLSSILPLQVATAFLFGVLLGLAISQGVFQAFNRLFAFYFVQANLSETKRILSRSYLLVAGALTVTLSLTSSAGALMGVPSDLILLSDLSAAMVSIHMISYVPLYTLRKLKEVLVSYGAGFATLLATYFFTASLIPDVTVRYLISLSEAFAVLSIAPLRYNYGIFVRGILNPVDKEAPHFYRPTSISRHTIHSRFSIQVWESLPFILFGSFYFILLFGDRILSWIYNPVTSLGGTPLPFVFNVTYHAGADLALLILFPAMIIQYVMTTSIFEELFNLSDKLKANEAHKVDRYLRHRYTMVLLYSILATVVSAIILLSFGPMILGVLGGSQISYSILTVAVFGNIFISVFAINAQFLLFLNKAKRVALISMIGALSIIILGTWLGSLGFQNIVYAYSASSMIVALLSSIGIRTLLGKIGSFHFSRYV